jgi:hypothetical protein
MTIGGPLRGMSRAARHSLSYGWAYAAGGSPIVIAIGLIWGDTDHGNFTGIMLIAHLLSVVVILPAAIPANLVSLRLLRPRSWRQASWRAWVAGVVAVPMIWGGMSVCGGIAAEPPEILVHLLGGAAFVLYGLSFIVLFSNFSVAVAWALPPWNPKRVPRRRPESEIPPSGVSRAG